jgi:hypothetical protein
MTSKVHMVAAAVAASLMASALPAAAAITLTNGARNSTDAYAATGFDSLGFSNPSTFSVPRLTVQYEGTLAFPDIPIQGNFPVFGSTGPAAPDWRPFEANGYTLVTTAAPLDSISFSAGNADTDLLGATLFLHVEVLGAGNSILGDFVSSGLSFAGTLGGGTSGYGSFLIQNTLHNQTITGLRLNVTTSSQTTFNPFARDWTVLDNIVADNTALSLGPEPSAGVPEPSAWTLLLSGFGLVGWILRGRHGKRDVGATQAAQS